MFKEFWLRFRLSFCIGLKIPAAMDSPEDSPDRVERVWNTPPYQCPHCDKPAFGSYNAMVMHFRDSVHILRCNECGDHWFPSISHVLIHYFEEHRRFYNRHIGPRDGRKAKEHLPKRAPRSKRAPKGKRAPVKAQDERPCKCKFVKFATHLTYSAIVNVRLNDVLRYRHRPGRD